MKAPSLFIATSLLVWGWQVEQVGLAVSFALLLEASRLLKWQWPLSDKMIYRLVDVCAFLLVVLAFTVFFQKPPAKALSTLLQWMPVVLFPVVAVQYFGNRDRIPLAALSLQHRRHTEGQRSIDLSYPYFVICLIAASTGNRAAMVFYLAVASLWTWALWQHRNTRHNPGVWAALILMAGSGGYLGHTALIQLQGTLMEEMPSWLLAWFDHSATDPYQRSTAMGTIGRLKQSNRIVLRITNDDNGQVPELLQKVSYNLFRHNTWFASSDAFKDLPQTATSQWQLTSSPHPSNHSVNIVQTAQNSSALLPLPFGAQQISNLSAKTLQQNALGSVKAQTDARLLDYRVDYTTTPTGITPTLMDRAIPAGYGKLLAPTVVELGLREQPPNRVPIILKNYFNTYFSYSLDLAIGDKELPPVIDFLRTTRTGHCEYFASSTVLLLRQAGIPARYVSGFSVQEYSDLEKQFIVRQRHAHAWAIAYIDGAWQTVDTTPTVWQEIDARQSSVLTPLYDVLSWVWLHFQEWRLNHEQKDPRQDLVWLLFPLSLILTWRMGWHKRFFPKHYRRSKIQDLPVTGSGIDSACYQIVAWYQKQGMQRKPHQTLRAWLAKLTFRDNVSSELIKEIVDLHYRYRFDPIGLNTAEREQLEGLVQQWLAQR
jgi:transglutaminase-like putative cysteine protease